MASQSPPKSPITKPARPTGGGPREPANAYEEVYAGWRMATAAKIFVLLAATLFLCALGGTVVVHLAQPFARALLVAALAIPVTVLLYYIWQSWKALAHTQHTHAQPRPGGAIASGHRRPF
ncbi:MAG: hypothetical protein HYR63_18665 [Proteobacteria bacterium]|nr:hypothetical protein [Pseudomonadota bacterium]MBI3499440.1 hypothetical protein [Pseudomonadota bacterium]